MADTDNILEISDLSVSYGGTLAVCNLALEIERGSVVGLVGESGSGKSTVLKSIAGLLGPTGHIDEGRIIFEGRDLKDRDLAKMSRRELAHLRGGAISYVVQDPTASLDPLFTIKNQFDECIRSHRKLSASEMEALELEMLADIGFDDPGRVLKLRPFELSGGMCQRVVLAMGLACGAQLVLADEPTSALDVIVQAQIIELLKRLRDEHDLSILIVSHNMGVMKELADTVGVMYQGHLVEFGATSEVFENPVHPYTRDLIAAIPKYDGTLPELADAQTYEDLTLKTHGEES